MLPLCYTSDSLTLPGPLPVLDIAYLIEFIADSFFNYLGYDTTKSLTLSYP